MRKNYLLIFIFLLKISSLHAAHFTITPTASLTYTPASLNATVGDTVTMIATGNHPVVEVSQATWNALGNTPLAGGFGLHSTTFDLVLMTAGNVYFVCNNHHSSGMRGQIVVTASGISELSNQSNVSILANPSGNGQLAVANTLGKPGLLYIFDVEGKLHATKTLSSDAKQNVDIDLPAGLYLCRFSMEGNWNRTERLFYSGTLN